MPSTKQFLLVNNRALNWPLKLCSFWRFNRAFFTKANEQNSVWWSKNSLSISKLVRVLALCYFFTRLCYRTSLIAFSSFWCFKSWSEIDLIFIYILAARSPLALLIFCSNMSSSFLLSVSLISILLSSPLIQSSTAPNSIRFGWS